jgi:outer membrane immunogenic protein
MKNYSLKHSILASAVGLLAAPALAADLPVFEEPAAAALAAPVNWAGPYLALFAGYGWGDVDVADVDGYNASGFSYDADGFYGGMLVGFNWQASSFVFGLEGELGYLGLDDSAQYPPYVGVRLPSDSRSSIDTDLFASLTARAGIATGNLLFYVKGGGAALNADVSYIDNDPAGTTLVAGTSNSEFMTGWTAGGGIEFMNAAGWIARGEYMYADLGDINVAATSAGGGLFNFNHDVTVHTAKVAIGRKF